MMTQPTREQIEAAAKAIAKTAYWVAFRHDTLEEIATAALTAAAQVGDEPSTEWDGGLRKAIAATIERCAQVADDELKNIKGNHNHAPHRRTTARIIAAAIRAMKD